MTTPACTLCMDTGEVVASRDATGSVYVVCGCQPTPNPNTSRCFKCREPYCRECTGARCPCAEVGNNWDCVCREGVSGVLHCAKAMRVPGGDAMTESSLPPLWSAATTSSASLVNETTTLGAKYV